MPILITIVPILFMVVGALMYALCANPKLAELGRLMFQAGAIAVCIAYAGRGVTLGTG